MTAGIPIVKSHQDVVEWTQGEMAALLSQREGFKVAGARFWGRSALCPSH
jgi:hypothetical protein